MSRVGSCTVKVALPSAITMLRPGGAGTGLSMSARRRLASRAWRRSLRTSSLAFFSISLWVRVSRSFAMARTRSFILDQFHPCCGCFW